MSDPPARGAVRRAIFTLCACALASVCCACRRAPPLTQIVVAVDSDWDGFERADIEIGGFEKPHTAHADLTHAAARHVALVHDGGPLGPISVTVRAYAQGAADPVLIERRTGIYFVEGKTRLLRIDLLLGCVGLCDAQQACLAGPKCVDSEGAARLSEWQGDIGAIPVVFHVKDGAGLPGDAGADGASASASDAAADGGASDAGGTDAGRADAGGSGDGGPAGDAGDAPDAGDAATPLGTFQYAPSNVDPADPAIGGLSRAAVSLDCASPSFDSTDLSFSGWCGPTPSALVVQQDAGHDAALLVMSSLDIAAGTTLQLQGDRPVILLVFGAVHVGGVIDASAHGATPGPGAERDCTTGLGASGRDGSVSSPAGAAGGGGGGFGTAGGTGAGGKASAGTTAAGGSEGDSRLVPLRGGCAGGASGKAPSNSTFGAGGRGGGAVQLSAAGQLEIAGSVVAAGGGGGVGADAAAGGGGGGSGGAILLEGSPVAIGAGAVLAANGGGGGAGQPYPLGSGASGAGEDGHAGAAAAAGGVPDGIGGAGGQGAWRDAPASDGVLPSSGSFGMTTVWGGGGGGGGGSGRIQINAADSCSPPGTLSPLPAVTCPS